MKSLSSLCLSASFVIFVLKNGPYSCNSFNVPVSMNQMRSPMFVMVGRACQVGADEEQGEGLRDEAGVASDVGD